MANDQTDSPQARSPARRSVRPGRALRSELLEVAMAKGVHPGVLDELYALPDRRYANMRDLCSWVPEEAGS
jgi:hypothetical protein